MPQRLFTKHPMSLKLVLALGHSSEPEDKVSVSTDKGRRQNNKKTNNNNKNLKMPGCVNKEQGDMET